MAYAYGLLSDAELLRALNQVGGDLDDQMKDAHNTASQEIHGYLERVVIQASWIEYHQRSRVEPSILRVLHWPISSITEVAEDSSRAYGSSTVLTVTTDYIVDTNPDQSARIIRVSGGSPTSWLSGFEAIRVKVTGAWTLANLPPAIKSVCRQYTARHYDAEKNQNYAFQSISNDAGNVTHFGPVMLTKPMKASLADYKDWGSTTAVRWELA